MLLNGKYSYQAYSVDENNMIKGKLVIASDYYEFNGVRKNICWEKVHCEKTKMKSKFTILPFKVKVVRFCEDGRYYHSFNLSSTEMDEVIQKVTEFGVLLKNKRIEDDKKRDLINTLEKIKDEITIRNKQEEEESIRKTAEEQARLEEREKQIKLVSQKIEELRNIVNKCFNEEVCWAAEPKKANNSKAEINKENSSVTKANIKKEITEKPKSSVKSTEKIPEGVLYKPGEEPENIKQRITRLCSKLDEAYPDRVVVSLHKDHKKWGETVTELYRLLGYPDGNSFLTAYGYTIGHATSRKSGASDLEAVVERLKQIYPNGTTMSMAELKAAHDDIPFRTLEYRANKFHEMTLREYLINQGILIPVEGILTTDADLDDLVNELKRRYSNKEKLTALNVLIAENPDLPISKVQRYLSNTQCITAYDFFIKEGILNHKQHIESYDICTVKTLVCNITGKYLATSKHVKKHDLVEIPIGICDGTVFGTVEDVRVYKEKEIDDLKMIKRKIQKYEISNKLIRNALIENASIQTNKLIESSNIKDFRSNKNLGKECNGTTGWAVIRGLASEVMSVMDYLVNKDVQTYDYKDVMMTGNATFEMFVYSPDVLDIIEKFPFVKAAMFAINEDSNIVEVCYSRSGYSVITDISTLTHNNSDWTKNHSPVEDFMKDELNYKFMFRNDWESVNYAFIDSASNVKHIVK